MIERAEKRVTEFLKKSVFFFLLAFVSCTQPQKKAEPEAPQNDFQDSYYTKGKTSEEDRERDQKAAVKDVLKQPLKKRIMVFNFVDDTKLEIEDLGAQSAHELRLQLADSGKILVAPDSQTPYDTQNFVKGDVVKVGDIIREGRKLGLSAIVIGRVSNPVFRTSGDDIGVLRQTASQAKADVEIKIFDIAGGREVHASGRTGEAVVRTFVAVESKNQSQNKLVRQQQTMSAVREASIQLVPEVFRAIEKMTWEGRIAKIMGTKIFISAGRSSGLIMGDILKVTTNGEDIVDPSTGVILGRTDGRVKGTLELVEFVGEDAALAAIHTGGQFQVGDLIRLY